MLANPLVYMCEGFRAALTPSPHMSLWACTRRMLGFSALFTWLGINGFKRRVPDVERAGSIQSRWVSFDGLCRGRRT